MSDHDALFRAILQAPEDDAPRLIFADWLDENGDEARAEFIRLQCKLARIPMNTNIRRPLQSRCQELERQHSATWLGPFRAYSMATELRRGFVDDVQFTTTQFVNYAEQLQALAPIRLWRLRPEALFRQGVSFRDAVNHPAFAKVREIEIGYYGADELLNEIAESPYRTGLRGITVYQSHAGKRELQRFFAVVPTLSDVTAIHSNAKQLAPLWRYGSEHRLRRLELTDSKVLNEVVANLADSPALEQLEGLYLDDNPFDDRGIAALAESETLRNLRELSLADISMGNEGAVILAGSPILRHVRLLNLTGCDIDAGGCQALADSPYLQELELLCLDRNRVSIGVENELANRFGREALSIAW